MMSRNIDDDESEEYEENTMPLPRVYKSTVPNDEIFENVLGIVNINNLPVLVNTDEVSAEVNNVSNQISDAIGSTSFVHFIKSIGGRHCKDLFQRVLKSKQFCSQLFMVDTTEKFSCM